MFQMKIFNMPSSLYGTKWGEWQDEINDWLRQHPDVEIVSQQCSMAISRSCSQHCTIVLLYKVKGSQAPAIPAATTSKSQ
jgi:hypothetical protein